MAVHLELVPDVNNFIPFRFFVRFAFLQFFEASIFSFRERRKFLCARLLYVDD